MNDPAPPDELLDDLLNDLLDGRLDSADEAALRVRIEAEPAVREAWDELCRVRDWVCEHAAWTEAIEPPPELAAAVRARTTAAPPERSAAPASHAARPAGRLLRMLTVAYAAAALLVVGLTVRWVFEDRGADTLDGGAPETTTASREALEEKAEDRTADVLRKRRGSELARLEERDRKQPVPAAPGSGLAGARSEFEEDAPAKGGMRMGGSVPRRLRKPKDAGASSPAPARESSPTDQLREQLADARRAGEQVYVIEADDAVEGLREARRLLASLAALPAEGRKTRAAAKEAESGGTSDADEETPAPSWRLYPLEDDRTGKLEFVTSFARTLSASAHRRLATLAAPPPSAKAKKSAGFEQAPKSGRPASTPAPGGSAGAPPAPPSAPAAGAKTEAPAVRVRILILRRR